MITFIIPTIYKSPFLIQLLRSLDVHPLVSEILLVEDCPSTGILNNCYFNKLNVVPFQERKYCNGGWNLGINLTKTHYYALCSDDILFPTTIIDDVLYFYKSKPNSGVIGMDCSQYETEYKSLYYGFKQKENWFVSLGWGALQFNHKNNPLIIPGDLKHWCGDTYNLYYSKYPCYDYFGEKFYTTNNDHGTSTNEEILEIGFNDQRIFEEKYKLEKPIWA
jgi:hypothetical protein